MFYLIAIVLLAVVDQITKFLVLHNPGMGGQTELVSHFLYFNVIRNEGVAFGMLENAQSLVVAVTAFLTGAILVYILLKKKNEKKTVLISLTMIAGGALGNLIDRIRLGYVTDFIDIHIWPFVFNFADICVVLGCLILFLTVLFPARRSRRK